MTAMEALQSGDPVVANYAPPSATALRRIVSELNLDKTLVWKDVATAAEQFHALVAHPPFRSVVVQVFPAVAEWLLNNANDKNRPLQKGHSHGLKDVIADGNYELTGDTFKFSMSGRMLDGQHRANASRLSKQPITTHMVFGLEDDIFDVVDQGKKRSPGDVLALLGVKNSNIVAGAVRQVLLYTAGAKGNDIFTKPLGDPSVAGGSRRLTARLITKLAMGSLKGVQDYSNEGAEVSKAFKQPPTMVTALLYMISKHSRAVAMDFQHEWVHGNRLTRNKNFDILNGRLMEVARAGGGHVNRTVRAAMVIQCFNHWNAGMVANPRALTWTKKMAFPKLVFNKEEFLKRKDQEATDDTSLPASQNRLLLVLGRAAIKTKDGNVQMPFADLSEMASVPRGQVSYVLDTMEAAALLHCVKKRSPAGPAIWRLKDKGFERLRTLSNGSGE